MTKIQLKTMTIYSNKLGRNLPDADDNFKAEKKKKIK